MKYLFLFIIMFVATTISACQVHAQNTPNCAKVLDVRTIEQQPFDLNSRFTCIVSVDNPTTQQRENIACGISINGEYPSNFCPSQKTEDFNYFQGWRGNQAYFNCVVPYTDEIINASSIELVGDDFSEGCKQQSRVAIPLTIKKPEPNSPNSPNKVTEDAVKFVEELIRMFGNPPQETPPTSGENPAATSGEPVQSRPTPTDPLATQMQDTLHKFCSQITTQSPVDTSPFINIDTIRQVLTENHSPALDEPGVVEAFYNYGVQYGINPAVLLGFFAKESTFGQDAIAQEAKSVGYVICPSNNSSCPYVQNSVHKYKKYTSWAESAQDWYRLIRENYINLHGLYTVETIVPRYAPSFENDLCAYIDKVLYIMNKYGATTPTAPTPIPTPKGTVDNTYSSLSQVFETAGKREGVPAKIIEGIARYELPWTFDLSPAEIQAASLPGGKVPNCDASYPQNPKGSYNSCSAKGPMQFTTGIDNTGSGSCSGCCDGGACLSSCPNTWPSYANAITKYEPDRKPEVCNLIDSAEATGKMLKEGSTLTNSCNITGCIEELNSINPNKLEGWGPKEACWAGCHYYGRCDKKFANVNGVMRSYCGRMWEYANPRTRN